jgi:hypothetical protein
MHSRCGSSLVILMAFKRSAARGRSRAACDAGVTDAAACAGRRFMGDDVPVRKGAERRARTGVSLRMPGVGAAVSSKRGVDLQQHAAGRLHLLSSDGAAIGKCRVLEKR